MEDGGGHYLSLYLAVEMHDLVRQVQLVHPYWVGRMDRPYYTTEVADSHAIWGSVTYPLKGVRYAPLLG